MIKRIFVSWDFALAVAGAVAIALAFPRLLPTSFAKDIYGAGISVLAILFSVYFAALAIIMASSDDSFVAFLEQVGDYSRLINTFLFSLVILFIVLICSLVLYTYTSYLFASKLTRQSKWWLVGFGFLFLWGLFAAAISTWDAVAYSKYRSRYVLKLGSQTSSVGRPTDGGG